MVVLLPPWLRTLVCTFAPRPRRVPRRRRPFLLEALEDRAVPSADVLYIGDNASNGHGAGNSVQSFDAGTGASLGTFVPGSDSLKGVRGMIFDSAGHLLVANQDVNRGKPGEIMKFDANTGAFVGDLVPFQDPNAPFGPRGIVLKDNVLYVANLQDSPTVKGIAPDGEIDRYNGTTGQFLGAWTRPSGWVGQFNPRGVVFGPDGKLYVSVFDSSNLKAGYVLQYDVGTGAETTLAFNNGDNVADPGEAADLHRPEGLTFGPDGKLYVTGFRADSSDNDKIVVLDPSSGAEVNSIALDAVGQPRAYGQAILFGPGGRLFVPISTGDSASLPDSPYIGAVRSYDVGSGTFNDFEPPGTLGSGWYLTFRNTDPATLAYGGNLAPKRRLAPPAHHSHTAADNATLLALTPTTASTHARVEGTAHVHHARATVRANEGNSGPAPRHVAHDEHHHATSHVAARGGDDSLANAVEEKWQG
jgi:hypothetical protein